MAEPLRDPEYAEVWDRFEAAFSFAPSMTRWPGIREPTPSVTWSLADDDLSIDDLDAAVRAGLTACTPPGGTLLALDWQHTSYRFAPHADDRWPPGVFPDGDYFALVAEDLSYGSFGHPWEPSLCLFGADLLAVAAADVDRVLGGRVLRRDGITR
jgi:hypothetical protein